MTIPFTWGASAAITYSISGCPCTVTSPLSRPPSLRPLPPARMTPQTGLFVAVSGMVRNPGTRPRAGERMRFSVTAFQSLESHLIRPAVLIRLDPCKAVFARLPGVFPCASGKYATAASRTNNNSHSVLEGSGSITAASWSRDAANPRTAGAGSLLHSSPARR